MNDVTIIIFGATGDLTKRKLIPALYDLVAKEHLEKFLIIGAAKEEITTTALLEASRAFIGPIDQHIWRRLQDHCYYQQLNFVQQKDYKALNELVNSCERTHKMSGNRLVYLAAPATFFCAITTSIGESGLVKRAGKDGLCVNGAWQRIVYEKPFGHDLASARAINECITNYFDENQIFRIDHYLTKEIVGSIALVRFTNIIFEPLWNNLYVDNVQIILSETLGMEGRGAYYDDFGILKDVVQNHLLQLLALIAMESPERLLGDDIRDQKAAVLQYVQTVDGVLGQYVGYTKEPGVQPHSTTPTFAVLRMLVDTPRWRGVPFYIRTGKALDKKDTSIHIKFKAVDCPLKRIGVCASNYLTMQIAPNSCMSLQMNIKKPSAKHEVMPVDMMFSHERYFGPTTAQAYEQLLLDVMKGEASISVRFDEIELSWKVTESIERLHLPLVAYEPGSAGPLQVDAFLTKYGIRWQS